MTTLASRSSERGAELVEFAMVLPLLLLVFGGIVDFGLMLQRLEVVTNAAREGARLASMPNYAVEDVEARVNAYLLEGLGAGTYGTVAVSMTPGTVTPGVGPTYSVRTVTVALTANYIVLGPLMALAGANGSNYTSLTLTGSSTMRTEMSSP
jgi:Flp pilus assembly protein TadG